MLEECPVKIFQVEDEFVPLLTEYRKLSPRQYAMEIGGASGGSLFFWIKYAMPNQKICVIDRDVTNELASLWKSWVDGFKSLGNINLLICKADSTQLITYRFITQTISKLDFLFIDGSHDYDDVKADYILYSPLVRKGGIIAFHDINNTDYPNYGVKPLWDQIKLNKDYKEFITMDGVGGIGLIYV